MSDYNNTNPREKEMNEKLKRERAAKDKYRSDDASPLQAPDSSDDEPQYANKIHRDRSADDDRHIEE